MLPIHQEQQACSITTTSDVKTSLLSPKVKAKLSVSFSAAVEVFFVLHNDGYTCEETVACWLSPREYKQLRKEIRVTLDMMENNEWTTIDEEKYCVRGVRTEDDRAKTWMIHMDATNAVLEEQELLRDKAITRSEDRVEDHAEEIIACTYRDHVYDAQKEAYLRGVADEQIAGTLNSILGFSPQMISSRAAVCGVREPS
jgi:hypothetical protein